MEERSDDRLLLLVKRRLLLAIIFVFDVHVVVLTYRASIDKILKDMLGNTTISVVRIAVLEVDVHSACFSFISDFPNS